MEIFLIFSLVLSIGFCEVSRPLEDARSERNRLVAKYLKTQKKEEGAIRLIGGQGEWEGEFVFQFMWFSRFSFLIHLSDFNRKCGNSS